MFLPNYKQIISNAAITSVAEVHKLFEEEVMYDWSDLYRRESVLHGNVTWQNFKGFTFGFDYTCNTEAAPASSLPDSRLVAAFGISNHVIAKGDRQIMRKYIGDSTKVFTHFGTDYEKGHYIAHHSGGPIDINLFPQRKDVNRGWSEEGKRYRTMEKYIAMHPGTFVFSRPIYKDYSCCPYYIEFGYCDEAMNIVVNVFSNR